MLAQLQQQILRVSSFPPTCSGSSYQPRLHPCMADPALEGLLCHFQSLGVAQSICRTYQAGVRCFQIFCTQYAIAAFPTLPLTLRYFCCYMACQVSYMSIKVYLAGIRLEHLERPGRSTKDELLHLLYTGINPLTRKILIKNFTWKLHHYFSFHASSKGPLKAPAMAEIRSARTICYT